jgi:hypothetical protein
VRTVKFQLLCNIYVGNTITVCEAERLFIAQIWRYPLESASGHSIVARVYERNSPRFGISMMHFHLIFPHVESDVRHVQKIIREILLYDISLVPAADDEIPYTVGGKDFEDVPKDRFAADLNHGLRSRARLFANPRSEAARKDDCFQFFAPCLFE